MRKRLLSMLLVCFMVLGLLPVSALADSAYTNSEGTTYTLQVKNFTSGAYTDADAPVVVCQTPDGDSYSAAALCSVTSDGTRYYAGEVPAGSRSFRDLPAGVYTVECYACVDGDNGMTALNPRLTAALTVYAPAEDLSYAPTVSDGGKLSLDGLVTLALANFKQGQEPPEAEITYPDDPAYTRQKEVILTYVKNGSTETSNFYTAKAEDFTAGEYTLTAVFLEDASYEKYTTSVNFTVAEADKSIQATVAMSDVSYGNSSYGLVVNVTDPAGYNVRANTHYFIKAKGADDSTYLPGVQDRVATLPVGEYVVKAVFSADGYEGYEETVVTDEFAVTGTMALTKDDVDITIEPACYTGKPQKVKITGITLKDWGIEVPFDLTSSDEITEVGASGSYTVTFKDGYSGTVSGTFSMAARALTEDMVGDIAARTYTGGPIEPAVTVSYTVDDETVTLVQDTDFTVEYSDNTDAGNAAVKITGQNGYTGEVTTGFEITPLIDQKATVELDPASGAYTGSALTPAVTVTAGGLEVDPSEYEVYYYTVAGKLVTEMTDVGTYTVRVMDKPEGNFIVGGTAAFVIVAADITPAVSVPGWTYGAYDAETNAPVVTGNAGNGAVEYTYHDAASNAIVYNIAAAAPGSYYVVATIAATGSYNGGTARSDAFEIAPADPGLEVAVSGSITSLEEALTLTPSVTAECDDHTFTCESANGRVAVTDNGDGTFTLTAVAAGDDTVTVSFHDNDGKYADDTWSMDITVEKAQGKLVVSRTELNMTYGDTQTIDFVAAEGGTAKYQIGDTDVVSVADGKITALKSGTTDVVVSLQPDADHDDSSVLPVTITVTVARRPIKVAVDSYTLNYGDEFTELVWSVENEIESAPAVLNPVVEGGWEFGSTPDAGTYAITIDDSDLDTDRYVLTEVTQGTLTVNKAAIIVRATSGQTAVYGSEIPATFDYEYVGSFAVPTDTELKNIRLSRVSDAIGVGEYDLVFNEAETNAANPNYEISYSTSAKFTITPMPVTVTADDVAVSYGAAVPGYTYTADPEPADGLDPLDITLTCEIPEGSTDAAIGTYDIIVTAGSNPNYTVTPVSGVLTVFSTEIGGAYTVSLDPGTFTYDGTQKCPVVTLTIDATGTVIDADEYTVSYKNNTNAGDAYVVIKDKDGGNLSLTEKEYKFTIDRADEDTAELHMVDWHESEEPSEPVLSRVKQASPSVTYTYYSADGTALSGVPTVPGVYYVVAKIAQTDNYNEAQLRADFKVRGSSGITAPNDIEVVYGDDAIDLAALITAEPDGATLSFESTDESVVTVSAAGVVTIVGVGTADIKVGLTSNSEAYPDIDPAEMVTVVVSPKPVTVTVDAGQSKAFGDADPAFTYTVTDDEEVSVVVGREPGEAVGGYAYTVTTVPGANPNYEITVNKEAVFTITAKAVTPVVTLYHDSYTYDGEAKTPGYHVAVGSTILDDGDYTAVFSDNTNAGTAKLTVSPVTGGNYTFEPVTAEFTIAKADISPVVEMGGWTYGEYDHTLFFPETYGNPGSGEVTINITDASGSPVTDLAAIGVGTYTVTADIAETANYKSGSCQTTFKVTRATPTLSVGSVDVFTYGDPSFELEIETNSNATPVVTSSNEKVLTVGEDGKIQITGAGTAALTVSVQQTPYYKAASASIDVTVGKKDGALTVSELVYNVTYGGDSFRIGEITQESPADISFASSDTKVVTVDAEGNVSIVGAGEATVTLTLPATDNYLGKTAEVTVKVAKAAATITAADAVKTYGESDPALSYELEGLAGSDTADVLDIALTRAAGENVGQYEIVPSHGENPNYDVTVVSGHLTIEPKALDSESIELAFYSRAYNGEEQKPEVTVTDPRTDTAVPAAEYSVVYTGDQTNAGTYTVFVSDNEGGNYAVNGYATYTITKADISPAVEIYGWTYGGPVGELVITGNDGYVIPVIAYATESGDEVADIAAADAGRYKVTVTIPETPNYNGGEASAVFEIAKADSDLTVEAVAGKTYRDDKSFALVTSTASDGAVTFSSNNTAVLSVDDEGVVTVNAAGTATITVAAAEGTNYKAGSKEITVTVAKKQATLEITNMKYAVTYGDAAFSIADVTAESENEPTFTSSNPSVAAVDENGVVTVVGVGEATIRVDVAESGNFLGVAKDVTVTVAAKKVTVSADARSKIYGEADPELTYRLSAELVDEDDLLVVLGREEGESAGRYVITPTISKNPNYDVSVETAMLTIEPKTVTDPVIILDSYAYIADGTEKKPAVAVYDGDTLIPASAYEVTYSDNTEPGTATVSVSNLLGGNYIVSGTVFFDLYRRGDVNGDGKVNYVDDVYLCRYLANWEGYYPNMLASDIKADGVVNYADEIYLARALAGWPAYVL